jgi:hypothetical protein
MADDPPVCDVTVCTSHGNCQIDQKPNLCKVWGYLHGHGRSPAAASFLSQKISPHLITNGPHGWPIVGNFNA